MLKKHKKNFLNDEINIKISNYLGEEFFDDDIINAYLELICKRYKKENMLVLNSYVTELCEKRLLGDEDIIKKFNLNLYSNNNNIKEIIFPININKHWLLIYIKIENELKLIIYDSMDSINREVLVFNIYSKLNFFLNYLEKKLNKKTQNDIEYFCHKLQTDSYNCGVFVLSLIEILFKNGKINDGKKYFEELITKENLNTENLGDKLRIEITNKIIDYFKLNSDIFVGIDDKSDDIIDAIPVNFEEENMKVEHMTTEKEYILSLSDSITNLFEDMNTNLNMDSLIYGETTITNYDNLQIFNETRTVINELEPLLIRCSNSYLIDDINKALDNVVELIKRKINYDSIKFTDGYKTKNMVNHNLLPKEISDYIKIYKDIINQNNVFNIDERIIYAEIYLINCNKMKPDEYYHQLILENYNSREKKLAKATTIYESPCSIKYTPNNIDKYVISFFNIEILKDKCCNYTMTLLCLFLNGKQDIPFIHSFLKYYGFECNRSDVFRYLSALENTKKWNNLVIRLNEVSYKLNKLSWFYTLTVNGLNYFKQLFNDDSLKLIKDIYYQNEFNLIEYKYLNMSENESKMILNLLENELKKNIINDQICPMNMSQLFLKINKINLINEDHFKILIEYERRNINSKFIFLRDFIALKTFKNNVQLDIKNTSREEYIKQIDFNIFLRIFELSYYDKNQKKYKIDMILDENAICFDLIIINHITTTNYQHKTDSIYFIHKCDIKKKINNCFQIKPSNIKNAGKGLFAKEIIQKFTLLQIEGKKSIYKPSEEKDMRYLFSYLNRYGIKKEIDSKDTNCFASLINDIDNYNVEPLTIPHILYEDEMFLCTTKEIKKGEELSFKYGVKYWNASEKEGIKKDNITKKKRINNNPTQPNKKKQKKNF